MTLEGLHRRIPSLRCASPLITSLLLLLVLAVQVIWGHPTLSKAFIMSRHSSMRRIGTAFLHNRCSANPLVSRRMAQRWLEGDSVWVNRRGNSTAMAGVVREHKGNGWYTVEDVDSGKSMKCRASAMFQPTRDLSTAENLHQDSSQLRTNRLGSNFQHLVDFPAPTIVDLDEAVQHYFGDVVKSSLDQEFLQQVAYHLQFDRWVVFTDLHCAPSTLETCLQVLRRVHELAVEREAGVMFLGDFWHTRSILRVDNLNAVLQALRTWTVPMVMIPGNHDQVSYKGTSHSITPLENAYRIEVDTTIFEKLPKDAKHDFPDTLPGPLILSEPTKFAGALFIPHIRDICTMETVLQSPYCQYGSDVDRAEAIFCHADVKGGFMNDGIRSVGGVPPHLFPDGMPIYTGHFHLPHVIKYAHISSADRSPVSIEYLGSPYQVSLSEADQSKSLVVLERSQGWKTVEKIPLSIGPRNFRRKTDEFLDMKPPLERSEVMDESEQVIRVGDRVVVFMDQSGLDHEVEAKINSHAEMLRESGVQVEIRTDKKEAIARNDDEFGPVLEERSVEETWKNFLQDQVARTLMTEETAERLQDSGLDFLENDSKLVVDLKSPILDHFGRSTIDFVSVSVDGFGPFSEKVVYPLDKRGLVLIQGKHEGDKTFSDENSNGSGKSSLATAALWCLTGSIDPKPSGTPKVSDIVNDASSVARVTIQGRRIDGDGSTDFAITRSRMKQGTGHSLTFVYDGTDASGQGTKETQDSIEETLGIRDPDVMTKTIFCTQFGSNSFLESSETAFKEELSPVVAPLTIWKEAALSAKRRKAKADKRANELDGMVSLRESDMEKYENRLSEAKSELAQAEKEHEGRVLSASDGTDQGCVPLTEGDDDVDESDVLVLIADLEESSTRMKDERNEELEGLQLQINHAIDRRADIVALLQDTKMNLHTKKSQHNTAILRITSIEDQWGRIREEDPHHCPTCGQSLSDSKSHELASAAKEDLYTAQVESARLADEMSRLTSEINDIEERVAKEEEVVLATKDMLVEAQNKWTTQLNNLEAKLHRARMKRDQIQLRRMSFLDQQVKEAARKQASQDSLDRCKVVVENIQNELEALEGELSTLNREKDEQQTLAIEMKQLSDAFGSRGIQSYLFQNTVDQLQHQSQRYLNELSDGSLELSMFFDEADKLVRQVNVKNSVTGESSLRALPSLSGGQWRRCALSIRLGFADLVAQRGILRSNLLVMDEPLTHLDRAGRTKVGQVLRSMLHGEKSSLQFQPSTILLILQDLSSEELEEVFDARDVVIKSDGGSRVEHIHHLD